MTEQPTTVDALDREAEHLRGEKRQVMAALRASGGHGDGDGPGRLLERLDALDRALVRLGERRLRAVAALCDPGTSERRRERRAVALGRWLETRSLTLCQMRRVEALAGDDGHGLFADEALAADGWRRDAHGHWHGPLSPRAAVGPVGDVVVLAQARGDVERTLAPSFEQVLSGGELVALDEPDEAPIEPPEDVDDAERAAWNDARNAPVFSREYAARMQAYAAARQRDGTRIGADGRVIDSYAELVQARARALVTERVEAARAAMGAYQRSKGSSPPNPRPAGGT